MNFKKTVERQVESMLKSMGALVKTARYKEVVSVTKKDYKPVASYLSIPLRCLITDFSTFEIAHSIGQIQVNDKKVIIPLKDFTGTIQPRNYLIIDDIEYAIQNVETDPTGTFCTCQIRK